MPRTGAVMADVSTGRLKAPIEPDDTCPLSLEPLDEAHAVYLVPCGHVFGSGSNLIALMACAKCPMCRMLIREIRSLGSLQPIFHPRTRREAIILLEGQVRAAQARGESGLEEYTAWAEALLHHDFVNMLPYSISSQIRRPVRDVEYKVARFLQLTRNLPKAVPMLHFDTSL